MAKRRLALAALVLLVLLAVGVNRFFPRPKEPGYRFVRVWGDGLLDEPIGIAIAGEAVVVSDAGNDRIVVFDREGGFLRAFGSEGDGPGELGRPMHLDIWDDAFYVAEYLNDRIQVFDLDGNPLRVIGRAGDDPAGLNAPGGVAVAADGSLFVADFYRHRVVRLDATGRFLGQFGTTDAKSLRAGRFNYPTDVALLSNGDVVVADAYNDRVQVFSAEGRFRRKWGGPFAMNLRGGANGWFRTATSVTVAPDGTIFVSDFDNDRVQKFTASGRFLASIGRSGSEPGELRHPTDVAVDEAGFLYVVDFGNDRIQKFAPIDP